MAWFNNIADNARDFAQEVIRLLKDKDLRQNVAQNARNLVEEKYGWSSIVMSFDKIYDNIQRS